ncbi:hypothetical protein LINPERHAP1_LOCUS15704 [Linum perenne]
MRSAPPTSPLVDRRRSRDNESGLANDLKGNLTTRRSHIDWKARSYDSITINTNGGFMKVHLQLDSLAAISAILGGQGEDSRHDRTLDTINELRSRD